MGASALVIQGYKHKDDREKGALLVEASWQLHGVTATQAEIAAAALALQYIDTLLCGHGLTRGRMEDARDCVNKYVVTLQKCFSDLASFSLQNKPAHNTETPLQPWKRRRR